MTILALSKVLFDKFSKAIKNFGYVRSNANHSIFTMPRDFGSIILIVYVDDIPIKLVLNILTASFTLNLWQNLGLHKYFLHIEIISMDDGTILSQRRYVLDLMAEVGLLDCKPVSSWRPARQEPSMGSKDQETPPLLKRREVFSQYLQKL